MAYAGQGYLISAMYLTAFVVLEDLTEVWMQVRNEGCKRLQMRTRLTVEPELTMPLAPGA